VKSRIGDLERYLDSCREKLREGIHTKKQTKPNKFSYKKLAKEGVIYESDVPEANKGQTYFYISMPELGVFQIEAKIAGISVPGGTIKLFLEELLDKKDNGETKLELKSVNVTLNVTPTVLLMNKHFLR